MDFRTQLERFLSPMANRIRMMLARAVIKAVNDNTNVQQMAISILAGELKDKVERFQNYGFSSAPLPGMEVLAGFIGGDRSNGVILGVADRMFRVKGQKDGEVAIYTDEGDTILLKRGRNIEVNTETHTINCKRMIVNAEEEFAVNTTNVNITATNSYSLNTNIAAITAANTYSVNTNIGSISALQGFGITAPTMNNNVENTNITGTTAVNIVAPIINNIASQQFGVLSNITEINAVAKIGLYTVATEYSGTLKPVVRPPTPPPNSK